MVSLLMVLFIASVVTITEEIGGANGSEPDRAAADDKVIVIAED